jgi:hypothetical protein
MQIDLQSSIMGPDVPLRILYIYFLLHREANVLPL